MGNISELRLQMKPNRFLSRQINFVDELQANYEYRQNKIRRGQFEFLGILFFNNINLHVHLLILESKGQNISYEADNVFF